jgi:hypothetical protein
MAGIKREEAHEHIAAELAEWFPDQGWTRERVAEIDRRLAVDDSDIADPLVHYADFALRVMDRAGLVEPYGGPGTFR